MYFNKIEHPRNCVAPKEARFNVENIGDSVYRLQVEDKRWTENPSQAEFDTNSFRDKSNSVGLYQSESFSTTGGFSIGEGENLLQTHHPSPFVVCGSRWILRFSLEDRDLFYGMGEKNNGFEKRGIVTNFWNTDVWADFNMDQVRNGETDSMYFSIPYLLVKRGNLWVGILVNSTYPVFMNTGANPLIEGVQGSEDSPEEFFIGSVDGQPDIFMVAGDSVASVTEKLYKLCGRQPLPPLWSLGFHQCRWGYEGDSDLKYLDGEFEKHKIPCSALWLDIDYMEGFRVFTTSKDVLPDPEKSLKTYTDKGLKIVPILDPGVKADPEYFACKEGLDRDYFCQTEEGTPYIGYVWPGASYFPDFSKEEVRQWWADKTADFSEKGFDAYWVDMNDPSTGSALLDGMRFDKGRLPHAAFHNQYGEMMQRATWDGLKKYKPNQRPFVLSRSGFIGTNKHGAIWMGDNISNWHHLRKSIEMGLNLSLSGQSFYGADIGGFGDDATKENFEAWHKALFLFPFFRNHSSKGTALQEPWQFGEDTLALVKTYIEARYALQPYLYNLFIEQEKVGHPIIRPLLYHYDGFDTCDDQFLVGSSIMQAPILHPLTEGESQAKRNVTLPEGWWFDTLKQEWVEGPCTIEVSVSNDQTPCYIPSGTILPLKQDGIWDKSLNQIDFIFFQGPDKKRAEYTYFYDRGEGYEYQSKMGEFALTLSEEGQAKFKHDILDLESPSQFRLFTLSPEGSQHIDFCGTKLSGSYTKLV